MKLNRGYRRDCIHRRAELIKRLKLAVIRSLGALRLSRLGAFLVIWKRSERTGRPRVLSTWDHAKPAVRSMRLAAKVEVRRIYQQAIGRLTDDD